MTHVFIIINNIIYFIFIFWENETNFDFVAQAGLESTVILLPQASSLPVPSAGIRVTGMSHHNQFGLTGFLKIIY